MAQQSAFSSTGIYLSPVLQTDSKGQPLNIISWQWAQNFSQLATQAAAPVSQQAPASSTAPSVGGEIATDGTYLYISTGRNSWKRVALSSF